MIQSSDTKWKIVNIKGITRLQDDQLSNSKSANNAVVNIAVNKMMLWFDTSLYNFARHSLIC